MSVAGSQSKHGTVISRSDRSQRFATIICRCMRLCRRCEGFQVEKNFALCAIILAVLSPKFCSAQGLTCPPPGWWDSSGVSTSFIPRPVFPTGNEVRLVFGKELNKLLSIGKDEGHNSKPRALVVLFYLEGDPPSVCVTTNRIADQHHLTVAQLQSKNPPSMPEYIT